jgi:two-component system chemotaxis response regulator CheY
MARRWILVVDDDTRLRAVWMEALSAAGYATVGAEDGITALELIRDLFPDLILLDLRMPRLSGWGFLDSVRQHRRWKDIPILIVSAYPADDDSRPDAEQGLRIVGRMQKPVHLAELVGAVRAAVGPSTTDGRGAPDLSR